jgi:hypothetical protein
VKACAHLEPLELALEAQGVQLGEGGKGPYDEGGVWFEVNCVFDAPALRSRLQLPEIVTYEEYDGRVAGSDATWYCTQCRRAIMGIHPRYAPNSTPRVS